ncbi:MAG: hypothetical protein NVS2B16_28750 [Chloroflexota bacterium]
MITTLQEFEESTAFERFAIGSALSLVSSDSASVDFRGPSKAVSLALSENLGEGMRRQLLADLRPLLFGGAWKILLAHRVG